jgi:AcrR family transcriptional regulator
VGTLYGYFLKKDEILREVLRHHGEEEIAGFTALINDQTPAIERLCLALNAFGRWVRDNRTLLISAFEVSARVKDDDDTAANWISKATAGMIREGIASGEFRPVPIGVTARSLISVYSMAMLGVTVWQGMEDSPRTLEDLEQMVRTLLT